MMGYLLLVLVAGVLLLLALRLLLPRFVLGREGQYFDSNGVRIHYTEEGKGAPVVLVHGLAFTAQLEWRRTGIAQALAREYRVITLDNRGHGRIDKPHDPRQYGVEMVQDLVRLLDHLGIDKAHFIGLSMGGFIIIKLLTLHPERVLSAAPCAAGWRQPDEANLAFAEGVAAALERNGSIGPLAEIVGLEGRIVQFGTAIGIRLSNDRFALAALMRAFQQLAVQEEALRANRVSALTIIGRDDGFLPDATALARVMAHHELVRVDGRNHMNIADTGPFLAALQRFLADQTQREPGEVGPNPVVEGWRPAG
ncbi:MAG: alpha/beta hydrolase [Candidatus Hydrogenedentes bacterium]|nr:alpha/beta hydrolase [Candidatus Hydrogenedentota bacterium]